jgi:hypothetical protein
VNADAEELGREAEQSSTLDRAARTGFVAYGVVHVLIGWLTIQLALGDHSENASATGALAELARQSTGRVVVWVVAIGLLLLVPWGLLEAAFGHRDKEGGSRLQARVVSGSRAVVYGVLGGAAVRVAVEGGGSGDSSQASRTMTARLMDLPAGQWLVVAVGLVILGVGAGLLWRGWTEKFADQLDTEGKMGWSGASYLLLGRVGHFAKGIAFGIVGVLFAWAGVTHEPDKSGGLDEALQRLLREPYGAYVLFAVALGFICYGLYCFARARHLDD